MSIDRTYVQTYKRVGIHLKMEIQDILYQNYVNQERERLISTGKCVEYEIDREKLDEAVLDTRKRLEVKLVNGECSQLIIEQIARHRLNIGEKFNNKIEFYNASEVIDMIDLIENDKVEHTDFTGPILNGFSKIHHGAYSSRGYSIVRNVKEYWYKKGEIRSSRRESFNKLLNEYERHGIVSVANAMHTQAMATKDLKGEWIIFKNFNGKKYFLCLATHSEGDEVIYGAKIKSCLEEFPKLKKNEC
jgi:hypothetical protein